MNSQNAIAAHGRVTFVIYSLGGGGAERVLANIANHFAAAGWAVSIVTLDSSQTDAYCLSGGINRVSLKVAHRSPNKLVALRNACSRLWRVRKAILSTRPDVVIAFMATTNILTSLSLLGRRIPIIASERSDPRRQRLVAAWSILRRFAYPQMAAVVVQTESARRWALSFVKPNRIRVIPNPVHPAGSIRDGHAGEQRTVIAVGRLVEVKGFDLLLRAFAQVHGRHPQWTLIIFGEGPLRNKLDELIEELDLAGSAKLAGWCVQIEDAYKSADVFVLSSRYEGFPNALAEAMAHGVPSISFDFDSGPSSMIRSGIDGLLVPAGDVEALASALDRLMSDAALRSSFSMRAVEISRRFSPDVILQSWIDLAEALRRGTARNA